MFAIKHTNYIIVLFHHTDDYMFVAKLPEFLLI